MIKKFGTFALFILSITAFAQTETAPVAATPPAKRYARPDIPGTFTVELGVNTALDKPAKFDLGFWGSRSVNIYYQYDIRILKSRLSFVPGIGFSLERFKFKNNNTLSYAATGDSISMVTGAEIGIPGIKKSSLVANYIEIPLELKYSTRPDDPGRSFKASIGGRIGWMYDAFTKVKYREDGETKKFKDNQNYNLTRIRYGVYAKIGVGNVSMFGYYNLTPMFKTGEGPMTKGIAAKDFNTFTVGISFASF